MTAVDDLAGLIHLRVRVPHEAGVVMPSRLQLAMLVAPAPGAPTAVPGEM